MILKHSRIFSFKLFGYRFLIWKKGKPLDISSSITGVGIKQGACKIVRHGDYIALAMPDGTIIPYQTNLKVKAPLNAMATARIELFVSI